MEELRGRAGDAPVVISGCIGAAGRRLPPGRALSASAARDYHSTQIGTFADTAADMVTALTMTYADEAIGVAQAARDVGLPAAISFTLETDGRLPTGPALGEAIEAVDEATGGAPAYYMVNCCASHTFRRRAGHRRAVARQDSRIARKRVDDEPATSWNEVETWTTATRMTSAPATPL